MLIGARNGSCNFKVIIHIEPSFGNIFAIFLSFFLGSPLSLFDLQGRIQIFPGSMILWDVPCLIDLVVVIIDELNW